MNRRDVLRSLAIIAAGSTVAIGCTPKDVIWEEGATTVSLSDSSAGFINSLSQVILPIDDINYNAPEPLGTFVQTMINDCRSQDDIISFGKGYDEYKLYLKEVFNTNLNELDEEQTNQLFAAVEDEESMPVNAKYFFTQIRQLSIDHFTSSEYYLTKYTKYEMVPSRFNGCAPLI